MRWSGHIAIIARRIPAEIPTVSPGFEGILTRCD